MEITDIIVRKYFSSGPLYAVVTVILDGAIAIHDIKAAKKPDGRLIAVMPARTDAFGRSRDVVHPVNDSFRQSLERAIAKKLNVYQ